MLLFLDEPTSGLDPGLERKLMYTLRRLADGGRTIVLVTHATQNIQICDHIAFLAGGRLVYFGPPSQALPFFGVEDFADVYAATESAGDAPRHWEGRYHASLQHQKYAVERPARAPAAPSRRAARRERAPAPHVRAVARAAARDPVPALLRADPRRPQEPRAAARCRRR